MLTRNEISWAENVPFSPNIVVNPPLKNTGNVKTNDTAQSRRLSGDICADS